VVGWVSTADAGLFWQTDGFDKFVEFGEGGGRLRLEGVLTVRL
jgi:hypothetical protein